VLLTDLFWICSCLPGYALARRCWPSVHDAGLLAVLASSLFGTFLVLSPISIACYLIGAPLVAFSLAVFFSVLAGLAWFVKVRAYRELIACLRRENPIAWVVLAGLLWLQARVGAYFAGDATFHLGRIRVLLEHGFTNRDIYLADTFFQHIYHTNLLYPLYASASQLTGQSYLETWFYSQAGAKLLVASGHYVLGYAVTRRIWPAWVVALTVITANAGETYTTYPNTIAVGWLLPMQLAAAYGLFARDARLRNVVAVAAVSFVTAQVHALYAVYAGLAIAPGLLVVAATPLARGRRRLVALGLVGTLAAVPFLIVSQFAFRPAGGGGGGGSDAAEDPADAASTAPPAQTPLTPATPRAKVPYDVPRWLPEVDKGKPAVPTPAVAVGGGHLEKSLELDRDKEQVALAPQKMGGTGFIALGLLGFLFAFMRDEERRGPLAAAAVGAVALSVLLFWPPVTTFVVAIVLQPFTVARLSTVLSSLLLLGVAVGLGELARLVPWQLHHVRRRAVVEALVLVLAVGAATRLTGHAPMFFSELVQAALGPREARHATLDMLLARREMLRRVVPPGTTVLTTARFARSVVMLCDCYVIIADRGHTFVAFARERREHLLSLNGPNTLWEERKVLLNRYGLKLVVFESRHLARLYRWSHQHGKVIGEAAGLEVVELRDL
jgi:hypothetical protein